MCNRYISPDQAAIERAWSITRRSPHPLVQREIFPRTQGPFLKSGATGSLELTLGRWGLVPSWAKSADLPYSTNNARAEELSAKPTFRDAWRQGQRCIIPAISFDEPCWETGRNVWWRFRRADGGLWGLAGLWNVWIDRATGELVESYTMLTVNADAHPVMSRMHKPDPKVAPDQQDKRSVVAIEAKDVGRWLEGSVQEVVELLVPPGIEVIEAAPV